MSKGTKDNGNNAYSILNNGQEQPESRGAAQSTQQDDANVSKVNAAKTVKFQKNTPAEQPVASELNEVAAPESQTTESLLSETAVTEDTPAEEKPAKKSVFGKIFGKKNKTEGGEKPQAQAEATEKTAPEKCEEADGEEQQAENKPLKPAKRKRLSKRKLLETVLQEIESQKQTAKTVAQVQAEADRLKDLNEYLRQLLSSTVDCAEDAEKRKKLLAKIERAKCSHDALCAAYAVYTAMKKCENYEQLIFEIDRLENIFKEYEELSGENLNVYFGN